MGLELGGLRIENWGEFSSVNVCEEKLPTGCLCRSRQSNENPNPTALPLHHSDNDSISKGFSASGLFSAVVYLFSGLITAVASLHWEEWK